MRLGMAALLIGGSVGLVGCTEGSGGGGVADRGYGYEAVPGPSYSYGDPSYVGVPTFSGGGYVGSPGWDRDGDADWRQRAWRNSGANPQRAERHLQEQRNAALLRQQVLQNQAIVQENRMRSIQQIQENRMRSIQQAQEARAAYQRQRLEAQQKKALGQQ